MVVVVGSRFTANIDSLYSASTLLSKAKLNNQSEAYLHKLGLGSPSINSPLLPAAPSFSATLALLCLP